MREFHSKYFRKKLPKSMGTDVSEVRNLYSYLEKDYIFIISLQIPSYGFQMVNNSLIEYKFKGRLNQYKLSFLALLFYWQLAVKPGFPGTHFENG